MKEAPQRARADRGDGSVRQVKAGRHAGKWRARLTYRDQWNRVQKLDRLFTTQREAKAYIKDARKEIGGGTSNTFALFGVSFENAVAAGSPGASSVNMTGQTATPSRSTTFTGTATGSSIPYTSASVSIEVIQ